MSDKTELILASASPRRQQLLGDVGCCFQVVVANVDESVLEGELPLDYVQRVAESKATAVHKQHPNAAVLAADTIVTINESILVKPDNQAHAESMWQLLSGQWHQVITAVTLKAASLQSSVTVTTAVQFDTLNAQQMIDYWASGEPQDKAGGYAIQGLASAWVQEVRGSYSNVVGLPLFETNQLLRSVGHNWL